MRLAGEFREITGITGELTNPSWLQQTNPLIARYQLSVDFSTGINPVSVELVQQGNTWQVNHFIVQTPLIEE